ncbi:MAG TPA: DUF6766 family protein [Gaiellaceae bacterium]|nr:DUF6766 family protein [Gaiellaceae bacterium]
MRRSLRDNSLSLFFLGLFLASLAGQSFAGVNSYNAEQVEHGGEPISWGRYLVSSHFGRAVMENWQSEFLQFTVFILATVWLIQKGSNESKTPEDAGPESDQKQRVKGYAAEGAPAWARARGARLWLVSNSLLLAMAAIFLLSWGAHSLTGWTQFNDEQREHGEPTVAWGDYVLRAQFWEETLQNWQSEFLAVGTMAVFTIYLRQRGSPESKPVGAPNDETSSSG